MDKKKALGICTGVSRIQACFRGHRSRNILITHALSGKMVCPFIATNNVTSKAMVKLVGEIGPTSIILDLGCGDGTLLVESIRQMQEIDNEDNGREIIGIELDKLLAKTAIRRLNQELNMNKKKVKNITIVEGDIMDNIVLIQKADIIFLFLVPSFQKVLAPILKQKCKPNVTIIVHQYPLPGWNESIKEEVPHHLLNKEYSKDRVSYIYKYIL